MARTFKMSGGGGGRRRRPGAPYTTRHNHSYSYNNSNNNNNNDWGESEYSFRRDVELLAPNPFKISYGISDFNGVPFVHFNSKSNSMPYTEYIRTIGMSAAVCSQIEECFEEFTRRQSAVHPPPGGYVNSGYVVVGHNHEIIDRGRHEDSEPPSMDKALQVAAKALGALGKRSTAAEAPPQAEGGEQQALVVKKKKQRPLSAVEKAWLRKARAEHGRGEGEGEEEEEEEEVEEEEGDVDGDDEGQDERGHVLAIEDGRGGGKKT